MDISILAIALLGCTLLVLSGCNGKLPFFSQKPNYALEIDSQDIALKKYLNEIIENRQRDHLEETGNAEIDKRRESYREVMIKSDLHKALEARGYYDGKVDFTDDPAKPFEGVYRITLGPRYTIDSFAVRPENFSGFADGPHSGDPLDAESVLTAQRKMRDAIQKNRCYFNLDVGNAVILDKEEHQGSVTFNVDAGPEARFSSAVFTGQNSVKQSYLKKLVPWKDGDCYRTSQIEALRTALLESGLFVRADAVLPKAPGPSGKVPVEIQLTERAHRTVRAGANYYSDQGPGVLLGWEHRNFFGAAETLATDLNVSSLKQSLDASLTKPFFLRKDQSLSLNGAIRRQDTDAFEEYGLDLGAGISRSFSKRLSGTAGTAFSLSQIKEEDASDDARTFALVSFPGSLAYDSRDSTLNPSKGWLLNGSLAPFVDALGESDPFFKAQAGASTYVALGAGSDYILALRAGVGSILGGKTGTIPPTERFYAGGGGSVRGFGYQEVGPKDADGDPRGGRSVMTASSEFRVRFTDKFGGVAFADAGSVSDETYPDAKGVAVGAGVGVRYFTDFGPLRFDIAVPLTQKEDLDRGFQFYISIGQAF